MKTIGIQGDIRIIKIDTLPKGAKKRLGNILVEGESTGNAHRLVNGEVYELEDRILFTIPFPTTIIHDEHEPIPLEMPGVYEIKRQREYTKDNMTRLVVD